MRRKSRRLRGASRSAGVTLLEALIALLVLAVALFLAMGLIVRQPSAAKRLASSDEALRSIEAAIETIRSDSVPLQPRTLAAPSDYPLPLETEELLLQLEIEPGDVEGLYQVAVEARYKVGRQMHRRRVETMVWRP